MADDLPGRDEAQDNDVALRAAAYSRWVELASSASRGTQSATIG